MAPIHILIADTSDELQLMVRGAVADQPDLLARADGDSEVEVMLHAASADVVIVGMSFDGLPAVVERLLDEYPDVGVIAIDVDRKQGLIVQLHPQRTRIGELCPHALGAAIRAAASRRAA